MAKLARKGWRMGWARLVFVLGLAACATGAGGDDSSGGDAAADVHPGDGTTKQDGVAADVQSGCNSENCAGGCCSGGTCSAGVDDTACGIGGSACVDCTTSSETCSNQACMAAPPPCSKTTCPKGCCKLGQCAAGLSDQACGTNGVTCIDCSKQGLICLNGFCSQ